jgi:hypothetical protein
MCEARIGDRMHFYALYGLHCNDFRKLEAFGKLFGTHSVCNFIQIEQIMKKIGKSLN